MNSGEMLGERPMGAKGRLGVTHEDTTHYLTFETFSRDSDAQYGQGPLGQPTLEIH
jgi:hypothetical protein